MSIARPPHPFLAKPLAASHVVTGFDRSTQARRHTIRVHYRSISILQRRRHEERKYQVTVAETVEVLDHPGAIVPVYSNNRVGGPDGIDSMATEW
jgi:hypothetical protein